MNSNFGKNFDFDLGLGSSRNKSLNDQKNKTSSYSSYSSSSSSSSQSKPAWQPNKPSWTHQPAAAPSGQSARPGFSGAPGSMVGDIFGKSWSSSNPTPSGIGIADKNPNLFGDLVNSALGQGKSGGIGAPLKNSDPAQSKSAFSMGNMANSLPKSGVNSGKVSGDWGSSLNYSSGVGGNVNRSPNLGGPAMNSGNVGGGNGGIGSKDPFGSLVDFGVKPRSTLNASAKNAKVNSSNDVFGDFQKAPKPSPSTFPTSSYTASGNVFSGSSNPSPGFSMDDFPKPATQVPAQSSSAGDPLDMFFTSSTTTTATNNSGLGGGQQSGMDDWGMEAEFGGDADGPTTEIDGLPPPPAGVSASAAKNKGMDNYKQGQYADAIKWLSWAVVLLEKTGNNGTMVEVLSSRAACYKEAGEYKKAVADCTKVLEQDDKNVSVLVQRALLYESMEKYRLGAEDLRTVLKIDPGNRIARSTVHRLTKLAD